MPDARGASEFRELRARHGVEETWPRVRMCRFRRLSALRSQLPWGSWHEPEHWTGNVWTLAGKPRLRRSGANESRKARMRRIDQLAIIAVTAVAGVGALFGTAATFAAQDKPSTTRDPDLPETPRQIADLFIADSYLHHSRGGKTSPYVDWFCEPDEAPRKEQKDCPITSRSAFNQLIGGLTSPDLRPQLLRAGKARDDCLNRSKARCSTGVPPPETCSAPADLPFCALQELKRRGINLGVVIGARNSTTGRPRPIKDLAWQARRIHAADKDSGFYDFLFLDLANELGRDLTAAVKYINEGKVFAGGDVSKASNWVEGKDCRQGWDVITNDNGWDTGSDPRHPLDTQAWGHAKNYEVAASFQTLERAASKGGQAITNADRSFIDHVNRLNPPGRLTTGAVLRVEVT